MENTEIVESTKCESEEISLEEKSQNKKKYKEEELFEQQMHYMTDSRKVSRNAKMTFVVLQRFGGKNHCATISLTTLAKKLGCSIPSVIKYIKELIAANIVKKERTVTLDGGYGCNRYHLSMSIDDWFEEEDYKNFPSYKKNETTGQMRVKKADTSSMPAKNKKANATSMFAKEVEPVYIPSYSLEFVHEHFNFAWAYENIDRFGFNKKDVSCIKKIICDVLNTVESHTFKIKGRIFDAKMVKSVFLKLNIGDIVYTLEKFVKISCTVQDYTGYLISMLYASAIDSELKRQQKARELGLDMI